MTTTTFAGGQALLAMADEIDRWRALWLPGIAEVEERLTGCPDRTDEIGDALGQVREAVWALITHLGDADAERHAELIAAARGAR